MLFLVWYDEDARRSVAEKIQNARDAYGKRFTSVPNLVLLNAADFAGLEGMGIEVRSERTVQPHNFWVGRSDDHDAADDVEEEVPSNG
jgi:hypothetical protein